MALARAFTSSASPRIFWRLPLRTGPRGQSPLLAVDRIFDEIARPTVGISSGLSKTSTSRRPAGTSIPATNPSVSIGTGFPLRNACVTSQMTDISLSTVSDTT
jgi:hypothetical protein